MRTDLPPFCIVEQQAHAHELLERRCVSVGQWIIHHRRLTEGKHRLKHLHSNKSAERAAAVRPADRRAGGSMTDCYVTTQLTDPMPVATAAVLRQLGEPQIAVVHTKQMHFVSILLGKRNRSARRAPSSPSQAHVRGVATDPGCAIPVACQSQSKSRRSVRAHWCACHDRRLARSDRVCSFASLRIDDAARYSECDAPTRWSLARSSVANAAPIRPTQLNASPSSAARDVCCRALD